MKLDSKLRDIGRLAFFAGDNWVSILGIVLTTGAGFTLVWSWFLEFANPHSVHPYVGIVLFMILPMVFVLGLLLIPLGMWLRRRKLQKAGDMPAAPPKIDFSSTHIRKVLLFVAGATLVNIILMGTATVRGVEYMDSSKFCGLTCHTPMIMEYRAFADSPHSRVGCAQCHIGPGAESFMRAKLAGVRQVFGVVFNNYSRPIPSPVETLRPARETCEACHWPQKFHGNKILVRTHYAEDAESTPSSTVLLLKIGGRNGQSNTGIHGRHLDETERITYVPADPKRQEISKITYRDDQGQPVEYLAADIKVAAGFKPEERKMDCVDCHNRPTHAFETPDQAVDRALSEGRLSRELPFVKKKALEILRVEYKDQASAGIRIPQAVKAFYQASYPDVVAKNPALVEAAAVAITNAFMRNVSPEMKLNWGTHPNHIGHDGDAMHGGCFRCHDGNHTAKNGRTIASDCTSCHDILDKDEKDPKKLLKILEAR